MSSAFPETRDTLVAALASEHPADRKRALDLIARAYREPVVRLLGYRWSLDRTDAEDLAQDFFARAIEKEWFHRYEAARGGFRNFLLRCVDDFVRTSRRDALRLKRGGGVMHLALDALDAADARAAAPTIAADALDRFFEREWARSVLSIASDRLRAECEAAGKEVAWTLFERYDLTDVPDEQRPTYSSLAADTALPATQVTNHLAWARKRMREHVLATLRALTSDEAEYRAELRALLGEVPT